MERFPLFVRYTRLQECVSFLCVLVLVLLDAVGNQKGPRRGPPHSHKLSIELLSISSGLLVGVVWEVYGNWFPLFKIRGG